MHHILEMASSRAKGALDLRQGCNRGLLCLTLMLVGICHNQGTAQAPQLEAEGRLERGFTDPPRSARPVVFWHWVSGCVTKEGITADLESMRRVGLAGAQLFPSVEIGMTDSNGRDIEGSVKFLSSEWRELVRHAVAESHRLELELSILNCAGWGQAGGRHISPAQSMQKLVWTETQVRGGGTVSLAAVPQPRAELNYYEDIALLALPASAGDEAPAPAVTSSAASEPIRFEAPTWPVLTMPVPMPNAPQWARLEFDREYTFSSIEILTNEMRSMEDPEDWSTSSILNAADQQRVLSLKGPRYWELQVSRDGGKTFEGVTRVSSHGTTPLPEVRGQIFRIWMPVPPPLQSALPLTGDEKIEIAGIRLAGPRIDFPEARTGQIFHSPAFSESATSSASVGGHGVAPENIITLTGQSEWNAPAGNWTLLRLGHTTTHMNLAAGGADSGLECDRLSREAMTHHLSNGMLGTVLRDVEPFVGTTLKNVLCDSWESGYENWTPRMREEFKKRRGYSMDPWLPVLAGHVVQSAEVSKRFLWDFRRTIADLTADGYYGTLRDFAHEHNMEVYAEAAGHDLPGLVDQLQCKGRTDAPMGEFWMDEAMPDTKEAASAAHIYGKKVAGAEAFTATPRFAGWGCDLFAFKAKGDLQFCMGINRFCLHRFAHQPWLNRAPGMTMGPWGSNFDRTNTWWEPSRAWITYLSRCQYLLQEGTFVADACYYYGEDTPIDFRFDRMSPPMPEGYDYDACNTEILQQMKVQEGRLSLPSGMSYRVLVLPSRKRMTPAVMNKIRELVQAGATVIGPKPSASPSLKDYPECDGAVASMANELWGDCNGDRITSHSYGAGRVLWGVAMEQALKVPPDFTSDAPKLKYIHRREGRTEIYFVSNQSEQAVTAQCSFRVSGLAPELWHPDRGHREQAAVYSTGEGRTTLPIQFDPAGSVFVIFRQPVHPDPIVAVSRGHEVLFSAGHESRETTHTIGPPVQVGNKVMLTVLEPGDYVFSTARGRTMKAAANAIPDPLALTGPWLLAFPAELGAPKTASFDRLISWTDAPDEGIQYFSGTATYAKEFTLPHELAASDLTLYLDLGRVCNVAEIKLNGTDLGVLWKPPFRVGITRAIKPGANRLEIAVTNLWPNRLIGDLRLPEAKRITWTSCNPYRADSPLLESGLLGPVTLHAARALEVASSEPQETGK